MKTGCVWLLVCGDVSSLFFWLKRLCSHRFSSKKRKPAWTDRILWRQRPKGTPQHEKGEKTVDEDIRKVKQMEEDEEYPLKIRQDLYTSNMEFSISDHKPVIGVFTLEVRTPSLSARGRCCSLFTNNWVNMTCGGRKWRVSMWICVFPAQEDVRNSSSAAPARGRLERRHRRHGLLQPSAAFQIQHMGLDRALQGRSNRGWVKPVVKTELI